MKTAYCFISVMTLLCMGYFLFKNFKICNTIYFSHSPILPRYSPSPYQSNFFVLFLSKNSKQTNKKLQKYGVCFVLLNYSKHKSCYRVWMVYPVSHTTDYLSLGGINYFPLLSAETLSVLCISFTCC